MTPNKPFHFIVCACLLAACVGFNFLFKSLNVKCCTDKEQPALHIIDIHLMKCMDSGWFDGPYVEKAASIYKKDIYKRTFLVADTIFPIVYSSFIISLGIAFRKRRWYPLIVLLIIAGALLDWGENFSFLSYLNNPSPSQASQVAFFTTLKSVLLPINLLIGCFLLIRGYIKRNEL